MNDKVTLAAHQQAATSVERDTPIPIAIVDYGLGNLRSVVNAFAAIGHPAILTDDPATVRAAGRVVVPGVGAAGEAMRRLHESGLDVAIREAASMGKPLLGLCLGMQLFFEYSEENDTTCLGLLAGTVRRMQPTRLPEGEALKPDSTSANLSASLKIPHIGWAQLSVCQAHPLLSKLDGEYIYFVHSYVCQPSDTAAILALADYCGPFVAIVGQGNIVAVQGHPERSDVVGLGLLKRFAEWQIC